MPSSSDAFVPMSRIPDAVILHDTGERVAISKAEMTPSIRLVLFICEKILLRINTLEREAMGRMRVTFFLLATVDNVFVTE